MKKDIATILAVLVLLAVALFMGSPGAADGVSVQNNVQHAGLQDLFKAIGRSLDTGATNKAGTTNSTEDISSSAAIEYTIDNIFYSKTQLSNYDLSAAGVDFEMENATKAYAVFTIDADGDISATGGLAIASSASVDPPWPGYADLVKCADGNLYQCIADHTADAATEPGTGASWASYWALYGDNGNAPYWSAGLSYSGGVPNDEAVFGAVLISNASGADFVLGTTSFSASGVTSTFVDMRSLPTNAIDP